MIKTKLHGSEPGRSLIYNPVTKSPRAGAVAASAHAVVPCKGTSGRDWLVSTVHLYSEGRRPWGMLP